MCQLWISFILASLAFTKCTSHPIVISPKSFRINATETVIIFPNKDETVTIEIADARPERDVLFQKEVALVAGQISSLEVKVERLPVAENAIMSISSGNEERRNSLVTIRDTVGFGFIQSDKPIYTPQEHVQLRLLRLDDEMKLLKEGVRLQIKNPQEIVMDSVYFTPENFSNAFAEYKFSFPPSPMMGVWHAVMSFGSMYRKNTNISFEVQEYVLPTFSVKLVSPKFITPSSSFVTGWVDAHYVYGKPLKGTVTFKFGVKDVGLNKVTWIGRTNPKPLIGGKSSYNFPTHEFRVYSWFPGIKNHRFVVESVVTENATGKREKVVDQECLFVEKPYKLSFEDTFNDFKPSERIIFTARVLNPFGQPVSGIPLLLSVESKNFTKEVKSDTHGDFSASLESAWGDKRLDFTVSTMDKSLPDAEQTTETHTMYLQESTLAYLIIENKTEHAFNIGDLYETKIYIQGATYLFDKLLIAVLVRGHIQTVKEIKDSDIFQLRIEPSMSPLVRITAVAYNNNYFIAESIALKVSDESCGLKLSYSNPKDRGTVVNPGDNGTIVVQGKAGDKVAFLAIDDAVYALRRKTAFQRSVMISTLKTSDPACGLGGGLNPLDVILNSGMLIVGYSVNVLGSKCVQVEEKRRTKRDVASIVRRFEGRLKDCCALGMAFDKLKRSCEARMSILQRHLFNDNDCQRVYLQCCKEVNDPKELSVFQSPAKPVFEVDRSRTDFVHVAYEDDFEQKAHVRHDFRETWLFDVLDMKTDTSRFEVSVPHSITTWAIEAMSLSSERSLCLLSKPLQIVAFKRIFIQVGLPYSVIKNEQVEMTVTVFNYASQRESVVVYMYGLPDVCSEAGADEKSERRRVTLEPNSAVKVAFPLVPLKVGRFDIKVVALSTAESDVVVKTLNVIPHGIPKEKDYTFLLDPKNIQSRKKRAIISETFKDEIDENTGIQRSQLIVAPEDNYPLIVPNSQECIISAIADKYGSTVKTAFADLSHLIRKPQGCGEQTMLFMAPTLFTLRYLDATNRLTGDKRFRGIQYLKEGYKMELMFRKKDGSFSAFQIRPSSLWLTSFVMKIFCQAYPYLKDVMDQNVLKTGTSWLLQKQNTDGSFEEVYPAIHRRLLSGVDGKLVLTPYVLISLRECASVIENVTEAYTDAVIKAEDFILSSQDKLKRLNNPLVIATAAYSLTFGDNPLQAINLTESLKELGTVDESRNRMFWKDSYPIEAASYALMAILKAGIRNSLDAQSIANYLNSERSFSGSFDSSQDTMVALEALSMFSNLQYNMVEKKIDLVCNITAHNHRFKRSIKFEDENALVMQRFKVDALNDMLEFVTEGKGVGLVSVKLKYNVLEPHTQFCQFDVTVKVDEVYETQINDHEDISGFFKSFPSELIEDLGIDRSDERHRNKRALNRSVIVHRIRKFWPYRQRSTVPPSKVTSSTPATVSGLTVIKPFDYGNPQTTRKEVINATVSDESVKVVGDQRQQVSKLILQLNICVHHLGRSDAEMSIVEVGLISGYVPDKKSLQDLLQSKDSLISKFETSSRAVILYLDSVPFAKPFCFSFNTIREVVVSDVQAAVVKVYDYYKKGHECSQFYSPSRITDYLQTKCESHVCECARRETCPSIKKLTELGEIAAMKMIHAREKLKKLICSDKYSHVWTGNIRTTRTVNGHRLINFKIAEVIKGDRSSGVSESLTISEECFQTQVLLHTSSQDRLIVFANQSSTGSIHLDNSAIVFGYEKSWRDQNLDNVGRLINWLKTMVVRNLWTCEP